MAQGAEKEISDKWVKRSGRTTPTAVKCGEREVNKFGGKEHVGVGKVLAS